MEKKLEVKNLRISFRTNNGKVQAVRDISFDLYKGETLAIVGESGSGKSVTSKAILGIQAGNAIYEGGEILYDGQDLLRITEEDFYKLRGDRIAMIFQDPLSSLNPIMRIGKQLTEAMLLKGKARQKACRAAFSQRLNLLEKAMTDSDPSQINEIRSAIRLFRTIEKNHTHMEQAWSAAHNAAEVTCEKLSGLLSRMTKGAFDQLSEDFQSTRELAMETRNPYVIGNADFEELKKQLFAASETIKTDEREHQTGSLSALQAAKDLLQQALARPKPDFFALGYVMTKGGDLDDSSIGALNRKCREKVDREFSASFLTLAEKGLAYNAAAYGKLRQSALEALKYAQAQLKDKSPEQLDEKQLQQIIGSVCEKVSASINPMDLVKDSAACTFSIALHDFAARYASGLKNNGKAQKKYEHNMARYNALVAKGKTPDWTVAAAGIIDLEKVLHEIRSHISEMIAHYEQKQQENEDFDARTEAESMIRNLQENAGGMVYKVTKHMARQRALKLMEEVGIPEPRKRYRAYPFEFSGGMRQRIVIAIALAANPDILICDEPTTALDVTIQAQILELINRLKRERNLSIIFITHDLGVVANMADHIAVMYAGKIVEYGKSEEIFYTPAHPYTWALLSSMPDLDTREKLEAIPGTPPNMIYPPVGDAFAARNKYAMQIDFEQQPPAFRISDSHWAATWLLHPKAPKVDLPVIVTQRIARMKKMNEERARLAQADVQTAGGAENA